MSSKSWSRGRSRAPNTNGAQPHPDTHDRQPVGLSDFWSEMATNPTSAPPLAGAHIGYEYQDLVAAALLAVGLVDGLDALWTEVRRGADTAFDDIELHRDGRTVRWQIKHSTDADRRLNAADLKRDAELSLRRMARAAAAQPATADEFRILVTWSEPDEEDLEDLLAPADRLPPTLPDWDTRRYKLDAGGSGEIGTFARGRMSKEGGHAARRKAAPRGANCWLRESMCQIAWASRRAMSTWATLAPRCLPSRRLVRW